MSTSINGITNDFIKLSSDKESPLPINTILKICYNVILLIKEYQIVWLVEDMDMSQVLPILEKYEITHSMGKLFFLIKNYAMVMVKEIDYIDGYFDHDSYMRRLMGFSYVSPKDVGRNNVSAFFSIEAVIIHSYSIPTSELTMELITLFQLAKDRLNKVFKGFCLVELEIQCYHDGFLTFH